ncbi:hypothetical protein ACI2LO_30005 [Streptomyces sp. NPDC033754]|uniref:hypothetical protein n=1 Tax=unclassified Streptomyces TaxID=2593676 RepID=UPI0033F93F74
MSTDQQSTDRQNLPRTGEPRSTVQFMVETLAAVGELRRDLQRELTCGGLRAAEAKGNKGGRRPAVPADTTDVVRTAHLEGRSIAALARDHGVSRGAVRTAAADLLPEYTAAGPIAPVPELSLVLDMPGKAADFLRAADPEPAARVALDQGVIVRRGQGYTLRVSATPAVRRRLLIRCQSLDGTPGAPAIPAQRKARHAYGNRVAALASNTLQQVPRSPRSSRGGFPAYPGHAPAPSLPTGHIACPPAMA